MRYASGVTDQYISFIARDNATDKIPQTVPTLTIANIVVYRQRNGGTLTLWTTPTIAEASSTLAPGLFTLLLDEDMTIGAGNLTEEVVLYIDDSASVMAPAIVRFELFAPANYTVGTVTTLTGHTAQTGDNFAIVNGSAGLVAIDTVVDAILVDTGTTIPATITTAQNDLDIITGASGVNLLTATQASIDAIEADTNELQADDVPGLIAALNDVAATDIVSSGAITTLAGAVVNVDLVDTTTTSTDMRGTDSANTTVPDAAGTAPTAIENADALLDRDMSTGTDSGSPTVRTVRQALRTNRNKIGRSGSTITVYKEDDTTASHTYAETRTASLDTLTDLDPPDA